MIVAMQRRLSLFALAAVSALIFAPELKEGAAFVLSKSLEVNAIRLFDGAAFLAGCF